MKKKARSKLPYRGVSSCIAKTLLVMKLTFILLTVAALHVSAKGTSQTVTFSGKDVSLEKVFHVIKQQTEYVVFFDYSALEGTKPITLNVRNIPLKDFLDQALRGQSLGYRIKKKTIFITKLPAVVSSDRQLKTPVPDDLPPAPIRGIVKDESGKPLIGANVTNKNTNITVATDTSGVFSINASAGDVLIITFVGHQRTEYKITRAVVASSREEAGVINVTLQPTNASMDDVTVVAVGYGKQKKEFLTASVSTVSGAKLAKAPVSNLSTALKGQLSGLVAMQSTGKPGSDGSILMIRGIGTYTGQTAPLIMVDGIARDAFDDIDPNEVASISILKDASATAVFGVRGANGVILITTKRGKQGAPSINLTSQTAVSSFSNFPSFANSYDYATVINERAMQEYWVKHAKDPDIHTWDDFVAKRDANWRNDGSLNFTDNDLKYFQNADKPTLTDGQPNPWYDPYFHPNTNWVDKLFKKYTSMSQANVNVSGGTPFMKYFVSLGYLNQSGLFKTDYMAFPDKMDFSKNRYNLRGNFDFDVTKDFKMSVNMGTQFVTISGMDNDASMWNTRILWAFPMSSPGMINGKYVLPYWSNGYDQFNPMYAIEKGNYWNVTNNSILNSSVNAEYKLDKVTPGLSIKVLGSYDSYFSSRSYGNFAPVSYLIRPNPNGDPLNPVFTQFTDATPPQIYADFNLGKWRKLYTEASINYNRSFGSGKHTLSAMVLGMREKKYDPTLQYNLPHAYEGVTARVNYNYEGKYIVEYDMGYNGSENFPEGQRFGYFPSYSGSWVLSNESFFPVNNTVNFVKLRASYGEVGNDNIGGARYLYLPNTWTSNGGYTFGTLNNQQSINGYNEAVLGNPNVTWEVSKEMNLAADFRLFKSKLSVTYEYYRNNRSNILSYKGTVPAFVQANLPPYNLGRVESWGHNFEFGYNDKVGDFNFYLHGNAAIQRNRILFQDEAIVPGMEYQATTGRPVGQQLLLKANGLYTSWSQLYAIDANGNPILSQPVLASSNGKPYTNANGDPVYVKDLGYGGRPLQPGDIRLEDINGDGVINEKDRVRTGHTVNPEYNFGLTAGGSYKGFDVSALFAGIAGVARGGLGQFHIEKQQAIYSVDLTRFTIDRYHAGDQIYFPMAAYDKNAAATGPNNAGNTFFLINTSYIRLQNLAVGYTLSNAFMKRIGIKSARFYVSGDNLYTWSPAKIWGDPENLGNVGYPLYKTYNTGVNINF
jgi:TonB-linked SusC/RagA family outer membrane protein